MKKYVFIMLTVVCCWIFCISVDVYAKGHGGHHGGHAVHHGGHHWRHGAVFYSDSADAGCDCAWTGYQYRCYQCIEVDD